ncbi:MAG: tRNA 4-thiouridine(8) synthase ThiI [Spirochaetia bacterium]|nr:tRNA 4-thiouridine(8) synthase ThiI [Spirochaetia bacterium]
MSAIFLIKTGEVLLKLGNQREFVHQMKSQIRNRLGAIPHKIEEYPGRFFLEVGEENAALAEFVLAHCPGVNGYAPVMVCAKTTEAILAASVAAARHEAESFGKRTFKVETRRSDKSFPLDSYSMSSLAGETILSQIEGAQVDVHTPDYVITIEIRERAYVYGPTLPGPRGLPSGVSGKGILMLSGGIDSPVAGYMMARRGLALEAAYFHTYPYTSIEAQKKVEALAVKIAAFCGGIRLWVIPFTEVQMKIKKFAKPEAATIMLRSAMMEAAHALALKVGASCIITGESLGQVASQTAENMRVTQAPTTFPVLRPLIGTDKEDTIAIARKIGTFDISILPYEDCCVLFSPEHPVLKPNFHEAINAYKSIDLSAEVSASIKNAEVLRFYYSDVLKDRFGN